MTTATLYLLSGSADEISRRHRLNSPRIVAFSEKQILHIGQTIALLRADTSDEIYFGAKALELQRYHQILKGMMFLAGKKRGALIDENGVTLPYSRSRVVFMDSFRLAGEICAAVWVVCAAVVELGLRKTH